MRSSALAHAVAWNRFSILLALSPRQYEPVTWVILKPFASRFPVVSTCGPRHRSVKVSCW